MKHVSAIIVPDSEPSNHVLVKFLIFFNSLSFYLPIEPVGADNSDNNVFTNLCSGYAPAPLGKDISRFSRLLREMETSRADELARLFSAAKAPMTTGQVRDQDETSSAGVYSALHKDAGTKTSIRHKERLWQARLILKLAELLDRREEEIRQGLAHVSSVERKLFASLEGLSEAQADGRNELSGPGESQHPPRDHILPDESSQASSGLLIPLRLKAWAELYLEDKSDQRPLVLAATSYEAGSMLLDGYENGWRQDPEKLFSLPVPNIYLSDREETWDQYLTTRNTFHEAVQENLEYFARFLQKTASIADSAHYTLEGYPLLADKISTWEKKVKAHFPGRNTGFTKLDFFCFPGIPYTELFQRLFNLEESVPANNREHPTGLLAILNP
jgi:hypothetical protein